MRLDAAATEKLVTRWRDGAQYADLCAEFDVSRDTVRKKLRAAGISGQEARSRALSARWAARLDVPPDEGDLLTGFRTCVTCRERKPMAEFYWRRPECRARVRQCSPCYKHANNTNPRLPINRRKYLYGITQDEYEQLLIEQDWSCAICAEPFSEDATPRVDHDHSTDIRRGLLCDTCNCGLGMFGDSVDNLVAAAAYLRRYL